MMINRDYPCNPSNFAVQADRTIEYIVIHYVGATGSARQNALYFNRSAGLGASAHFFVGHESEGGAIYQSVDPKDRAWHCGAKTYKHPDCRNANSIGIEMCCHKDPQGNWYFDDVTIARTAQLTEKLMDTYDIPLSNVLRHYDVTGKICPAPMVDEFAWQLFKQRLEGLPMVEKTGDNPSSWAVEHTEWAKAKGIIYGDGQGNYDWQGMVTREAIATILHNYAIAFGHEKE
jgi:N-acetyl-anhydromuramyl-L-alanine amidase AmpD